MSLMLRLPDDPHEYQQFLEDLLRSNDELRQQAEIAQQQAEIAQQHIKTAQQQVEDAERRVEELRRVLDQTAADYDQLKEEHTELAETLALLRRYVFGQRRERFIDAPGQGHLFDIPEIIAESEPVAPASLDGAAPKPPTATHSPRRTRLDHLTHIRIPHDVPECEKTCSCCGGPKTLIGEDESRELDFIPAKMEVKVHVLPKYACPKCRDGVVSPPVPPKPVPAGIAGAGLVSFVVVSKFADHLPLYRLEDILTRHGVYLSRSTLCDWVRNAALVLKPLAELQKTLVVLRQHESTPFLDRIEKHLDELSRRMLPKSALGKAITYARNQWAALRRYVSDGRLSIDNNLSEQTLRLQAIGRKNWEFLGSAEAGPRASILFTILAGAKRHHLEPWAYLRDVLLRLSAGETELEPLLPDRWGANHPEHVLQHRLDESRRRAKRKKEARQRRRAISAK
jgi:transposase